MTESSTPGKSYYSEGLLEEFISETSKKLETEPSNHHLRCSLANALAKNGMLEQAIEHYKECIAQNSSPEYLNNLGKALLNAGRYEEAISSFEKVTSLCKWPDAFFNLAQAFRSLGDLGKAVSMLERALEHNPKYREALNERAHILEALDQKDEAMKDYKKVIALFFAEYQAHDAEVYNYEMSVLLDNPELVEELIRQLRKHIQKFPGFADGYYKLGQALEAKGLKTEAMLMFRKALEINPSYETARKCFWKR
ncbi:MAG: tetratricopeptide repeat protein [Candidatus Rifleibacteriota bacterium]